MCYSMKKTSMLIDNNFILLYSKLTLDMNI